MEGACVELEQRIAVFAEQLEVQVPVLAAALGLEIVPAMPTHFAWFVAAEGSGDSVHDAMLGAAQDAMVKARLGIASDRRVVSVTCFDVDGHIVNYRKHAADLLVQLRSLGKQGVELVFLDPGTDQAVARLLEQAPGDASTEGLPTRKAVHRLVDQVKGQAEFSRTRGKTVEPEKTPEEQEESGLQTAKGHCPYLDLTALAKLGAAARVYLDKDAKAFAGHEDGYQQMLDAGREIVDDQGKIVEDIDAVVKAGKRQTMVPVSCPLWLSGW